MKNWMPVCVILAVTAGSRFAGPLEGLWITVDDTTNTVAWKRAGFGKERRAGNDQ
ncbi:MAG: hypothetical protein LBH70_03830 [Spirochaetaceae bacterium]|jgi:hypothetical protein|nr:hypothetical protein [Spirochaetaceae bacterium]